MSKGEFERIADYFAPLAANFGGAYGLTDDAATIAPGTGRTLVVTTDTIVERVHFIGDETADLIARKLLRVSLSDVAAMGAVPRAYTINIALRRDLSDKWLERFVAGLRQDQEEYNIHLIGGDSVSTSGPIVLTATIFGEVQESWALRRSGARPGDGVFVSGTLGDGALGLRAAQGDLCEAKRDTVAALVDRYRLPRPRTALGLSLTGIATAAADISDGLIADLGHIAAASAVGARIEIERLPLSDEARQIVMDCRELLSMAATGGDDYELVFTAPEEKIATLLENWTGVSVTQIGTITAESSVKAVDTHGEMVSFLRAGFRHA